MASFREEYEVFRRIACQFGVRNSLTDIWRLSLHLSDFGPLPHDYLVGRPHLNDKSLSELVYPWDLDVLARELVLHGRGNGTRNLRNWNHLAAALNQIMALNEAALLPVLGKTPDFLMELHRIGHRQFPWQSRKGVQPIIRTFKIYGQPSVDAIVLRELGMTTRQFLLLGMVLGGQFLTKPEISVRVDYQPLGIPLSAQLAFLRRITTDTYTLKAELSTRSVESRDWLYGWNPLEAKPLIAINPWREDVVQCPILRHLLLRTSSGLYYDLVGKPGFENPFGASFQTYVGDIIAATCVPPRFTTHKETSYKLGLNKKHGVDWILSDESGHIFIETKTKRMRLDARTRLDTTTLDEDLLILAEAIVQNYKNIDDAIHGKSGWSYNGLPVYPVVVTLEDWFLFSPRVDDMLRENVRSGLAANGLSTDLPISMPYTLMSVGEFEVISQVIAQVGVAQFMKPKTKPNMQAWSVIPFAVSGFEGELRHTGMLFEQEMNRLMPRSEEELMLPA